MKKLLPFVEKDPWLWPMADHIEKRYNDYVNTKLWIDRAWGSLYGFASAHLYFGLHFDEARHVWTFREWLPHARRAFLCGDFNLWDQTSHPLHRVETGGGNGNRPGGSKNKPESGKPETPERSLDGVWEIEIPAADVPSLTHLSRYKIYIQDCHGKWAMRMPAYTFYTQQDEKTKDFCAVVWQPEKPFAWRDDTFHTPDFSKTTPLIYEAHIGMAQEREGVGTYREFAEKVLPRIKAGGYNVLQLMAVAEHPYYGSFGYHVSNFFAPSSRFGTPDDLRFLVQEAHRAGISVVMDVVHAHFVKNFNEGLDRLDGSDDLYSYGAEAGTHPHWDSRMFNFSRNEVRQFLLSNLRYWMEEFHFDGFRFDGVTAMIYFHRGYTDNFGTYKNYFGNQVDNNALIYLCLANDLIATLKPGAHLSMAEEVSGMPGMTAPTQEGGMGFDYRLSMGIPDFWIKILKERKDEDWVMSELWNTVNNRLANVPQIAYAESHDQALVGDQTLAFRLMGAKMYTDMTVLHDDSVVARGIALHKMIRLFSMFVGGEGGGWLTFMGNEFGHPEWIDFPREGNGWSYRYARRQWSLADDGLLRYRFLQAFDRAMTALATRINLRSSDFAWLLHVDEEGKTLAFDVTGDYVFVFNWHPAQSTPNYEIPVRREGKYALLLCSDDTDFGGFGRVAPNGEYFTKNGKLSLYNINRAAQVFLRVD